MGRSLAVMNVCSEAWSFPIKQENSSPLCRSCRPLEHSLPPTRGASSLAVAQRVAQKLPQHDPQPRLQGLLSPLQPPEPLPPG